MGESVLETGAEIRDLCGEICKVKTCFVVGCDNVVQSAQQGACMEVSVGSCLFDGRGHLVLDAGLELGAEAGEVGPKCCGQASFLHGRKGECGCCHDGRRADPGDKDHV